ncbi:9770_t:CDS:2, partial [Ambispora leptoticha]
EKAIEWLQKTKRNNDNNFQMAVDYESFDDSLKKLLSDNKLLISWIPFEELEFLGKVGKGGFATVYAAIWERTTTSGILNQLVALKLFHGSKNSCEELIKELIAYSNIGSKNPTFLQCHGISKDESTDDYILIMQYAPMGSLRTRPNILKGTATCFAELLKRCWDENPNNRPSASEIHKTILNWKNNTEIFVEFLKSDKEMEIKNNSFNNMEDSTIYTSKFISYINQLS